METLWPKKKKENCYFYELESFVNKTTFNSHSFNKIDDFVATDFGFGYKS